jgi:ATP adenylyltransferase/5',5'''-P-1,P-4-tetraphosphate phosphorylase II
MRKGRAFYNGGMAGAGVGKLKLEMVEIPMFTQGPRHRHVGGHYMSWAISYEPLVSNK